MRIVETMSRGVVRALRTQFRSSKEALRELVDNALDHSLGQRVLIDIDVAPDHIVVENVGGRGMAPEHLAEFVSWGASRHDDAQDIGFYGQGGKAAIAYLGKGFRLWSRVAGTGDVFLLEDEDLMERDEPRDYGQVEPLPRALVPSHLQRVSAERGFVRIEVIGVNSDLHLDPRDLRRDLAATYGWIIRQRKATILLNDQEIEPRTVAMDDSVPITPIEVRRPELIVAGWVGKAARGGNKDNPPKPGISMFWRGRRILEGEWFGANSYGKGALASFYGELDVCGHWRPNLNKTSFNETGSTEWLAVGAEVIAQAKPVLDALRSASETTVITSRDRMIANKVRWELASILENLLDRDLAQVPSSSSKLRVRAKGTTASEGQPSSPGGTPRKRKPADNRQGSYPRMPQIITDSWEGSSRAETRLVDDRLAIAINKRHPAYSASTARYAVAEGAIRELLRSGRSLGLDEFVEFGDQALAEWAQLQQEADADD